MSLPPADWLALREPADAAARSTELTGAIVRSLPATGPLRILDLGTGTGANVRYLATRISAPQEWLVIDRHPSLLAEVQGRTAQAVGTATLRIERRCIDLATLDQTLFLGRALVTASALLDLVSESWLQALAERCAAARSAVLFALTYDGRFSCSPPEPEDDAVRGLVNRHQKTNNVGLGPAEGPDAAECATRCFQAAGYTVRRDRSDWALGPGSGRLQRELMEGWAQAAAEIAPDRSPMIQEWLGRRLAHVDAGRSQAVVGHEDVAGWPDAATSPARDAR
jgi:SAM-dependent methyltransferase